MAAPPNEAWIYLAHPSGAPVLEDTWKRGACATPALAEGSMLLRTRVFSVDPYLRGLMSPVNPYLGTWKLGEPSTSIGIAEVVESARPDFAVGDLVINSSTPWQRVYATDLKTVKKVVPGDFPLRWYVGPLGMAGMTAFFASTELSAPKAGETVFLSGAAGAVGSIAGQIYKLLGCRVLGSAGTDEKVDLLKSIGYDAAWNYKRTDTRAALREFAPEGIDIYFDNVGGETLEIALDSMRTNGRVVMCGAISQYNSSAEERYGVKNLFHITTKQLRVEGFLVGKWGARFPEGIAQLGAWIKEGKVRVQETVVTGFDNLPKAYLDMLKGVNVGKMVVEV